MNTDITLYAILDPAHCGGRDLPELARAALGGGATLLQYRDKSTDREAQRRNLEALARVTSQYRVPLIINDDPLMALETGAGGVHLGRQDMEPSAARNFLGPNAVIGLTVKSVADAKAVPVEVANHVFIGGVFETRSKQNTAAIGLSGFNACAQIIRARAPRLPIGAISGIDHTNVAQVIASGADGVAVISALFAADNVENAARQLRNAIETARQSQ